MITVSRLVTIVIVGLTHFGAAAAWAQEPATLPNQDSGVVQWLVAAGLAALICATAFLNPKRSHLG